jgi:3-hydroxyacyl-CoA dehydrogenase
MDWKNDLYAKIAPHIGAGAIVASNTSGLSMNALAEGCPSDAAALLRHPLLQPAALHASGRDHRHPDTDASTLDALETWLTSRLGKGVVRASTRPTSSPTASACSRSWP